ncbi:MAG TPA: IS1595 family transposase, partial [Dehalococcoidia bacterium]|nr:IS1595 family transposase [Dehalococcoidia bacterium]
STPKDDLVKLERDILTEEQTRAMLERIRWPEGPRCIFPDCGGAEVYRIEVKGKTYASGRTVAPRHLYKCKACRRQFSVTKGTIFEDSKIPLTTWIRVMYRMCSSKKGVSAYQIKREFGLHYEAAWFMCHRIRWAMTDKEHSLLSGVVEADETYVGGKARGKPQPMKKAIKDASNRKTQVLGMLERGGRVRAIALSKKGQRITVPQAQAALLAHIDTENAHLMTDEYVYYSGIEARLPHGIIRHKSEYVRGAVHTQGIESFWAGLKRQLTGTHHHVDAAYLNQYVQEHAFRHNTRKVEDRERFATLLGQAEGRVDWYLGLNARGAS